MNSIDMRSKNVLFCLFAVFYLILFLIFFIEIYITSDNYFVVSDELNYLDITGQWRFLAYALEGVDSYLVIGNEVCSLEHIGYIPRGWNVAPWGLLLGNVFYFGFLPYWEAFLCFFVFNISIYLVSILIVYWYVKKYYIAMKWHFLFIYLYSIFYFTTVVYGNCGGLLCVVLLLCLRYYEKYPVLSGILLGIAMIKPQISIVFMFLFFLLKAYKVVCVSLATIFLSFLIVCCMVQQTPLTLLYEFLTVGVGLKNAFYGLFHLAFLYRPLYAMVASLFFSLVCVYLYFSCYLKKVITQNFIFRFFPICVIALFAGYSSLNEFFLLMPFVFVILYFYIYTTKNTPLFVSYVSLFIIHFLYLLTYMLSNEKRVLSHTCMALFLLSIMVYYCKLVLEEESNGKVNISLLV